MKYDHMVKANGKYYASGEEVPEDVFNEEPISTIGVQSQFTRTDISRMNKSELQELAINTGVDDASNMTGNELKEYLISAFGL